MKLTVHGIDAYFHWRDVAKSRELLTLSLPDGTVVEHLAVSSVQYHHDIYYCQPVTTVELMPVQLVSPPAPLHGPIIDHDPGDEG
jgi:hypothetical protein